jgi:hypothetical protein
MQRVAILMILFTSVALWSQQQARAQVSGSRSTSQTMFGPRSMGTQMGSGRGTFAGTGGGLGQMSTGMGRSGMLTGNERFLRGNLQGQFIGRDAQAAAGFFETLMGGRESNTEGGNRFTTANRFRNTASGRSDAQGRFGSDRGNGERFRSAAPFDTPGTRSVAIRTDLRASFVYPARAPGEVSAAVGSRLRRVLSLPSGMEPEVLIEGRTATLRGVVASDAERILAERLARLEPGVSRVRNELRVEAPPQDPVEPVN